MYPRSVPYREGKNIVIYDAKLTMSLRANKVPSLSRDEVSAAIPAELQFPHGIASASPCNDMHYLTKSIFLKDFIRGASAMCIFLAFIGVILSVSPILYAEIASNLKKKEFNSQNLVYARKETVQSIPGSSVFVPIAEQKEDPNIYTQQAKISWLAKKGLPGVANWDFTLLIPIISLNSKVFPNVDPTNKDEYMSVLKSGVAHAKFTAFPGQEGLVYIFGHSTDFPWNIQQYNALFYDIKDLKEGDEIIILYNNKPYVYKTLYQKIVDGDNLTYLNSQTNAKMLILQTCWPPGTTWKRLIVVAQLMEENSL